MENNNIDLANKILFKVSPTEKLAVVYYTSDSRVYSHYTYPSNKEGAKECLKRISREKPTTIVLTDKFRQKIAGHVVTLKEKHARQQRSNIR